MQKTDTFLKKIAKIFLHGFLAGIIALAIFVGGVFAVAKAAENQSGGAFGKILNKILASGNWQTDTTGMVNNAQTLNGKTANDFQQTTGQDQKCGANMCMIGFNTDGTIACTPIK